MAKTTKPKPQKENKKEPKPMATTIENDQYNLDEAEDFKLPSGGVHDGNLAGVEEAQSQKTGKDMTVITATLSPEDPDAPNLPMRKYLTWPVEADRELMYGTRNAYGAQLQSIKEVLTAFGGQESGAISKAKVNAFLASKIGMAVKVKVKQELRKDPVTKLPVDPPEMQASIDKFLPA